MVSIYQVCLPDHSYEDLLPTLAGYLDAPYKKGAFESALEAFGASQRATDTWVLDGPYGEFTVRFEEYESYLFGTLSISGPSVRAARRLLYDECVASGAAPGSLETP